MCVSGSMACSVLLHKSYRILDYRKCVLRKAYNTTLNIWSAESYGFVIINTESV